ALRDVKAIFLKESNGLAEIKQVSLGCLTQYAESADDLESMQFGDSSAKSLIHDDLIGKGFFSQNNCFCFTRVQICERRIRGQCDGSDFEPDWRIRDPF